MRRVAATVMLALVFAGCTGADRGPGPGMTPGVEPPESTGTASPSPAPDPTRVEIYTAAFRSLADTERWFDPVLLDERICPGIGDVGSPLGAGGCEERFTQAEQAAILSGLSDLPGVRFVGDAERIEDRIFRGRLLRAGLLSVGVIDGDDERVTVGGRSYCGGLCAHWMTLVLRNGGQGWEVSGTTGPIAIA